ncbi:HAMP domain-containing protein [uncultured Cohaesibacter sp.]|uniref:HAMP domain-containing protein n=1 Tax=uncultured Cohaesibacter sp. TaxID=1002546 RepID=UPI0029C6469B|nr:HAMP domain-containing protein [uncultured Cohaesibacter sp.]
MTLKHRIWGVLLLSLVGLVVLSGSFYWGEARQNRVQEATSLAEENVTSFSLAEIGIRRIGALTEQFLQHGKLAQVEQMKEIAARSKQSFGSIGNYASKLSAYVDDVLAGSMQIVEARKIAGLSEEEGLKGQLRLAVKTVEAKLGDFSKDNPDVVIDAIMVKMLMLRRHEKDYMLRQEEKYIETFNKRIGEFYEVLEASAVPSSLKSDAVPLMQDYDAKFQQWVKANQTVLAQVDAYRSHMTEISSELLDLRRSAIQVLADAREERRVIEANVSMWVVGIIVAMTALLLVGGILVIRSITKPIHNVTNAMNEIAKGNLETEIPVSKQKDEIGELCKIAALLHSNVKAQKEMEAEEAIKKQRAEQEKRAMMQQLADEFDTHISGIVDAVSQSSYQLNATAQAMASVAEKTEGEATSASAASAQTLSNVQTIASATEEMTSSIAEISQQIGLASVAAQEAVGKVGSTRP